jgi:hypothetical protein
LVADDAACHKPQPADWTVSLSDVSSDPTRRQRRSTALLPTYARASRRRTHQKTLQHPTLYIPPVAPPSASLQTTSISPKSHPLRRPPERRATISTDLPTSIPSVPFRFAAQHRPPQLLSCCWCTLYHEPRNLVEYVLEACVSLASLSPSGALSCPSQPPPPWRWWHRPSSLPLNLQHPVPSADCVRQATSPVPSLPCSPVAYENSHVLT